MQAGFYTAKIIGAGFTEDSKKRLQPFIKFETDQGEKITWWGNIHAENPKAKEISAKFLVSAGFKGRDWEDLTKGVEVLSDKELNIKVVEETWNGKTRSKVVWCGEPRTKNGFDQKVSNGDIKKIASDAGLFASLRGGVSKPADDDLPF